MRPLRIVFSIHSKPQAQPSSRKAIPVELHCHSLFSVDGYTPPEELAEIKAAAGITTLALTDHNTMDGLNRCRQRAMELGIRFINGVEFDAMWEGTEYHFLAFGFDPDNEALRELCIQQFAQYPINFARIMPVLQQRYGITEQDLIADMPARYRTHPAPVLNKWFARGFLIKAGIIENGADMSDAVGEAEKDISRPWDWNPVTDVLDIVHNAGGILLVAHPAGYSRGNFQKQKLFIESLLTAGIDGFELYHPSSIMEPHFEKLVELAKSLKCVVSGGSDMHGDPDRDTKKIQKEFTVPDWVVDTIDAALERAF